MRRVKAFKSPGRAAAVLMTVACLSLATAATALGGGAEFVTGAGYSTNAGLVVLHAQAVEPTTSDVVPARGTLRALTPAYGSLTGTTTCFASAGTWPLGGIAVSGTLDAPVVTGGSTYSSFTFLLFPDRTLQALFLGNGIGPDCGLPLLFGAGLPGDGFTDPTPFRIQIGHFTVR